ncbi:TerD family protein [Maribacter forsetii]|uniref:TerD family protein n=1 Tax=Maribacter forsetii TaxID=444515 RepID=UPI0005616C77|nr:TerD family protein [Maribacter forsetii]
MSINLKKGQKIDLTKKSSSGSNSNLTQFCVGVNWGVIEGSYEIEETKGGFLGFGGTKEKVTKHFKTPVDLDASCAITDSKGNLIDVISFKQLVSKDGAVVHSGDDTEGDLDGDDGLDNEIISVNLSNISTASKKIIFFLNSYKKQDFATVPFASIRLYEGTPEKVKSIFATYDISADPSFKGYVSMIMGSLDNVNGEWKFNAIGDPVSSKDLQETVDIILRTYI